MVQNARAAPPYYEGGGKRLCVRTRVAVSAPPAKADGCLSISICVVESQRRWKGRLSRAILEFSSKGLRSWVDRSGFRVPVRTELVARLWVHVGLSCV
jgi:hypothetical protein